MLEFLDPLLMFDTFWKPAFPKGLYNKQVEIVYSVRDNEETFVPAGNMLGKDFVAGFIVLWFFLSALKFGKTCRVVTTSIKDDHLRVLWGEIGRFIAASAYPLDWRIGGPLVVMQREIKLYEGYKGNWENVKAEKRWKELCKYSYVIGQVSEKGEGMAGHHADYTLVVGDEASGIDDIVYTQSGTWQKRGLWIGNCNPCNNFFFKGVQGGDIPMEAA